MKRAAITIVHNGYKHLLHNGFAEFMADNFDVWVVVEGFAKIRGVGTQQIHNPSNDGTIEYMREFKRKHDNVIFYSHSRHFRSKDEQTNHCIKLLKSEINRAFLWQVDVDEQWTTEQLDEAEKVIVDNKKKQASFQFNHFVGDGIIAVGDWGSHYVNRLFLWRGQRFVSHIPSIMYRAIHSMQIKDIKYNHYSYINREDVVFKESRYIGYKGLTDKWDALQLVKDFPVHISALFPDTCDVSKGDTQIIRI